MGTASIVRVAAGIIFKAGRVLICKRNKGTFMAGYWEFPGGKCKRGESFERAVRRELMEELGIRVARLRPYKTQWVFYNGKPPCRLRFFKGELVKGNARAMESQEFRWARVSDLGRYKFLPADVEIIKELKVKQSTQTVITAIFNRE